MYVLLHRLMQPSETKSATVNELYLVMTRVMTPLAHHLVRQPIGGGLMAAPTFEVVELPETDPRGYLAGQAGAVALTWPQLSSLANVLA
jgi:hypothetical protein